MKTAIVTNQLCKEYQGIYRVSDLDLAVPEGSIYGFLGPNGAGKSTTLKMILGLAAPTKGAITIFEQPFTPKNRLAILREVGSLIESPSYYGHLTAKENLRILQSLYQVPPQNIDKVLSIVRLNGQETKKTAHYSLGMKQRLGLAMALLNFPKLLILDEPTNGLDPSGIQEMRELILSLPSEYGMTVLVSSHLLSEIDQIADTTGIIADGRLVYQNSLKHLHEQSRHYVAIMTSEQPAAMDCLSAAGYSYVERENWMLLEQADDHQILEIGRILSRRNIGLLRIEDRQKSLEDIFLTLTNKAVSL